MDKKVSEVLACMYNGSALFCGREYWYLRDGINRVIVVDNNTAGALLAEDYICICDLQAGEYKTTTRGHEALLANSPPQDFLKLFIALIGCVILVWVLLTVLR